MKTKWKKKKTSILRNRKCRTEKGPCMIPCLQALGIPGLRDPRGKQILERREFPSSSAMKGKEERKCFVQIFRSKKEADSGSSHCRIFVPSIKQDENVICRRWDWGLREVRKVWKRSRGQCGRKASTLIEKSQLPIRSEASGGTSQLILAWIRFLISPAINSALEQKRSITWWILFRAWA